MSKVKTGTKRQQRAQKTRRKTGGTKDRPRLHVYRSNRFLYAQIIDDTSGKTLVAASEKQIKKPAKTKSARAAQVGEAIAAAAKTKKIKKVRFDRGYYKYHGRVKVLAEAARKGGLEF